MKVQIGGSDIDGVLRGKIMKKSKFLSTIKDGFGKSLSFLSFLSFLFKVQSNIN